MGSQRPAWSIPQLGPCFSFFFEGIGFKDSIASLAPPTGPTAAPRETTCGGCRKVVVEFAQGSRGDPLCRSCIRTEDEALLEPLEADERHGLELLASVLDSVSWKYWKPGEQPAKLLDWLFLGDLEEATDMQLLSSRGITAVLNLINWWELSARLPDLADLASFYGSCGIEFSEADSEDRLFFDIVEKSWPAAEAFLVRCQKEGLRVLVNCKAGHNRSACICVCWLVIHEGMTLMEAVEFVQLRRGTILSNHGFRLQLVRLALRLGCRGTPTHLNVPPEANRLEQQAHRATLDSIIAKKRLTVKYEHNSRDCSANVGAANLGLAIRKRCRSSSLISAEVEKTLSQRTLKMELLACLYHRGKKFSSEYEYTSTPPTVIGSGFSGDVVLCRRREQTAVRQNKETFVRCVKTFDLQNMAGDKLEKLKNEAVIYLSLEHPHIARLFDVYEDADEVSLVMQYCSGGTLEEGLKNRGVFSEAEFQNVAVPMLMAVNYIHSAGIVHRDIKPRNWVYEADGLTVKLIDFGFSVKGYLCGDAGLQGCMGTLGYLAPEVVQCALSSVSDYTSKCDIWSLGIVFLELLTGQPAFHRDPGQCEGYTEEVILREIQEVTQEGIKALLRKAPDSAGPFLSRLLTKDPARRPTAREALDDPYLARARSELLWPPRALPVDTVLNCFRSHYRASKTSRAWMLAVARSPTYLPWEDFCALRDTFKMFDARGLSGTVNLEIFLSVVVAAHVAQEQQPLEEDEASPSVMESMDEGRVRKMWEAVCGEQESLSYCEFLAMLLPPIEEVFQDVDCSPSSSRHTQTGPGPDTVPFFSLEVPRQLERQWNPSMPVSSFLPLLEGRSLGQWTGLLKEVVPIFHQDTKVLAVVRAMSQGHQRWVIVRYDSGRHAFFDYMDINRKLLQMSNTKRDIVSGNNPSDVMLRVISMSVGSLANCSGHSAYFPASDQTPLSEILHRISDRAAKQDAVPVRRVPIVDSFGEVVHVFSCSDFLKLALVFEGPSAVLKSRAAQTFDRRSTILQVSVQNEGALLQALRIMDSEHLTICPATSREFSGDLGGAVASNVVSVSDLKWVVSSGHFEILDQTVSDFIAWRNAAASANLGQILRQQHLSRFNVVSVHSRSSLHMLAQRLLSSKLQRIFLSSDEIARIVGIVSSRDILLEVLDQIL